MARRIQLRRDTAANWSATNPTLAQGEVGVDLTNNKIKIGNGTLAWNSLAYFDDKVTDFSAVAADIIPDADNTRDLGSPAKQWRHVYTAGGSIYLDNIKLTNVGGKFVATKVINPGEENEAEDPEDSDATSDLSANLGNFKFDGYTIGTKDIPDTGGWGGSDIVIDPGAESDAFIFIPSVENQATGGSLQIYNRGAEDSPLQLFGRGNVQVITGQGETEKVFTFEGDNLILPAGGDILDSNLTSVLGGGGAGPVQPYLEVTNTPFIVQPVVLGSPVTVTVPLSGQGAQFTVLIENTSTTMSSGVTEAGTGYVVGQIYKIYYYQIGGSDASGDITVTVTEVNETGGIVSYDVLWSGPNVDGTYQFVSIDYQPASVLDEISAEVVLTRGAQQGIYNTILEGQYDNGNYLSPLGTEWNNSGWGNLTELGTRTYTTWRQALNNAVGNNIVASELVMRDIVNDRYYKFDFHTWGGNNNGYSYTRTEVTDPNYYRKPHNAEAADIVVEDDPAGTGIVIGRTDSSGIYNLAQETGFSNATSPVGTTWNADGWDDLSNIATRTYTSFDTAADGYNNVLGKKFVMKVASINKYYAIQFYEWATSGENNFAYVRYEIDQSKLNEGITFADGTKLKSAAGVGRVKSTAVGNRRIEEVTGYNSVSVTARTTNDYTGASARTTTTNYEIFVKRTLALDAVITPLTLNGNFTVEISFDGVTYLPSWLSSVQETEYWFYYENNSSYVPQTEDNPVYLRFTSGADPQVWWNKADLPGGAQDFRGAVIDYHAYTGESTIIGTIHIVDDSGEEHISHQEVQSGSTDGENDDLWFVQNEGTVSYRRTDGESKTLKIHWTAKVFYGSEFWD